MKYEEIILAIKEDKNVEYRDGGEWRKLLINQFEYTIRDLLSYEYRIEKENPLIKRYQILYTDITRKNFYLTSKNEKYTIEEFKNKFHRPDWVYRRFFHAAIPESEEEFDE